MAYLFRVAANARGVQIANPTCADESCQHLGELAEAAARYQIINVKLDKAGGLTEALLIAHTVKQMGRELLVSCMGGTSLAMAPNFVLAQICDYVELDGHALLKRGRLPSMGHDGGKLAVPNPRLWG
jgi:L-alanine-DL-glutamate epimerase-like enolase superfamily enzyme